MVNLVLPSNQCSNILSYLKWPRESINYCHLTQFSFKLPKSGEVILDRLNVKLKLKYFGHLMRRVDSLERLWCWEGLGTGGKGMTEGEMVGWHHRLDGREFEWTLGVGDGQGSLACCDSWGHKESDTTERLNWTECFII